MIVITVNQKPHHFSKILSLQDLVEQLDIATQGIAIAVNNHVITKSDWASQTLQHNDDVLIIQSTQGG